MNSIARVAGRCLITMSIALTGAANASLELQGRDINGNPVAGNDASAVFLYDSALNITWLRDANVNGPMDWAQANTWATTLTVGSYSGWRLPTVKPVAGTFNYDFSNNGTTDIGYGATGTGWGNASEMGHLFYATLGNKGYCTPGAGGSAGCMAQAGFGLSNTGDFKKLQSYDYWSGTEYAPSPFHALHFSALDGNQHQDGKSSALYAIAVRPGDVVASVPELQAWALMLAGLGAMAVAVRRRPR